MKTFEIEVVRTYTTTIEVKAPDNITEDEVVDTLYTGTYNDRLYEEIWEQIGEQELQQCDTELIDHKIKEL